MLRLRGSRNNKNVVFIQDGYDHRYENRQHDNGHFKLYIFQKMGHYKLNERVRREALRE